VGRVHLTKFVLLISLIEFITLSAAILHQKAGFIRRKGELPFRLLTMCFTTVYYFLLGCGVLFFIITFSEHDFWVSLDIVMSCFVIPRIFLSYALKPAKKWFEKRREPILVKG